MERTAKRMTRGFWETLERPIIGLAPMDGVTDASFRYMAAKYGKPSLTITEFTAAEGIRAGAERLLQDFLYDPIERPVVAQVFGADPDAFFIAGAVASALGFDGIDVNMGCPAKNVTQKGAGAALILDPERAREIIRQTKAGNRAWAEGASLEELGVPGNLAAAALRRREALGVTGREILPVSVKTRVGYDSVSVESWVPHLLEEGLAAITVHGRTLKQLYTGLADWDAIEAAGRLAKQAGTLALGNGDVKSIDDAKQRCAERGLDGVLIGRASFGNPWIFSGHVPSEQERIDAALEHSRHFASASDGNGFLRMRKHLLDYMHGFDGARELRVALMGVKTLEDVENVLLPLASR